MSYEKRKDDDFANEDPVKNVKIQKVDTPKPRLTYVSDRCVFAKIKKLKERWKRKSGGSQIHVC